MVLQRDWASEISLRVSWINACLSKANAKGVALGISGGKDSAAVAALLQRAGCGLCFVYMPIHSMPEDGEHSSLLCSHLGVKLATIDLSAQYDALLTQYSEICPITPQAASNIKPRLRMTTLYALAQSQGFLVAGTGNRSESIMGYFTKWGDGACDLNPIADLTATEALSLCAALDIPKPIIHKAPSAGLFEGQTDEKDMGISYASIDAFLATGNGKQSEINLIRNAYHATVHKRQPPMVYITPEGLPK